MSYDRMDSRLSTSSRTSRTGGRSSEAYAASLSHSSNPMKQMKNRSCSDRMSRPAFWAMLSEILAFTALIPVAIIYWNSCKTFSLVMISLGFVMFYMIVPQLVPLKICRPFRIHSYTKKLVIWGVMAIFTIIFQYVFAGDCIGWYWYGMALSLPAFLFLAASLRPPTEQSKQEIRFERQESRASLMGQPVNSRMTNRSESRGLLGSPIFDAFGMDSGRHSSSKSPDKPQKQRSNASLSSRTGRDSFTPSRHSEHEFSEAV